MTGTGNIAVTPAIFPRGSEGRLIVTKEQFDREKNYGAAMAVARMLLSKRLISEREYCKIDTIMRRKYKPIIGVLSAKSP